MDQNILDYGLIIKDMDRVFKFGKMEKSIQVNGLKILCVVRES